MIEVSNLSKRYGLVTAVDDVSFTVPQGSITGFLGPNGAGKSTTLRCIVGLTTPTSGSATIAGTRYVDLPNPALTVGTVLDASKLHPGRTGESSLRASTAVLGLPISRVSEVLDECGLTPEESRRRVATYSLGMRQRLCLALALLSQPEVLLLDEPVNGLDPQGIAWIRHLLRAFADAGGTVLLSSHLLTEVQKVADEVVMIGNGHILQRLSMAEVESAGMDLEAIYLNCTQNNSRGGSHA